MADWKKVYFNCFKCYYSVNDADGSQQRRINKPYKLKHLNPS